MTRVKLAMLAALALMAFGAVGTAVAQAEETKDGPPRVLILTGKVSELELTAESTKESENVLETAGGKKIKCTKATIGSKVFEEVESGKTPLDSNLAKVDIHFVGCKQGEVGCRSETSEAKDPIEVILVLLDLHLGAEIGPGGVLEPLLFVRVLPIGGTATNLVINCGGVKEEVKGWLPVLLTPGLTQLAAKAEVKIKSEQKAGKAVTGECKEEKAFCEKLEKEPLEGNLGAGFEKAGEAFLAVGSFTKDVFLDD